jgi:hypothetical protein
MGGGFNSPSSAFELCNMHLGRPFHSVSEFWNILIHHIASPIKIHSRQTLALEKKMIAKYITQKKVVANYFIKKMAGVTIPHTPSC